MKHLKILITLFCFSISFVMAQDAETAFHQAAGQYVKGSIQDARNTVASALQTYPNDPKLNSLKEKLEKEKSENKEADKNQEEKEENKENKEKQEEKNKDQNQEENKDNKEGEDKDASEDEKSEEQKEIDKDNAEENKEGEKGEKEETRSRADKLQEINLTEEKALMILEAMKNQEIQYIQQNKRKVKENADYGKPDW